MSDPYATGLATRRSSARPALPDVLETSAVASQAEPALGWSGIDSLLGAVRRHVRMAVEGTHVVGRQLAARTDFLAVVEDTAAVYAHLARFVRALRSTAARRSGVDLDRLALAAEVLRLEEEIFHGKLDAWCSRLANGGVDETSRLFGLLVDAWHETASAALEQARDLRAHAWLVARGSERFGEDYGGPAGAHKAPAGLDPCTDPAALTLEQMWTEAIDPEASLERLRALVDEISDRVSADCLDMLFIVQWQRLVHATSHASRSELAPLAALLLVPARFESMVGDRRFERFAELVSEFFERCAAFGISPAVLDQRWHALVDDEVDAEALQALSLPLQRLAARRGVCPEYFATHHHPSIAAEVVVHLSSLERLLELPRLDSRVLERVLQRLEPRDHELPLLLAHPACPSAFAMRELEQLDAVQLRRLLRSRTAPLAIKRRALRLVGRRRGTS